MRGRRYWCSLGAALLVALVMAACSTQSRVPASGDALVEGPLVAAVRAGEGEASPSAAARNVAAGARVAAVATTDQRPARAAVSVTDRAVLSSTAEPSETPVQAPTLRPEPTVTPDRAAALQLDASAPAVPVMTVTPSPPTVAVELDPMMVPTHLPPTRAPLPTPTSVPPTPVPPPPARLAPTAAPPPPAAAAVSAWAGDSVEQAVFAELNRRRAELGLPGLRPSPALFASAHKHSMDQSAGSFFGHTGSDGSDAGARMRAAGYNWANWGEAVARSMPGDISGVVQALLDSPAHRDILFTTNFVDGGAGVAYSSEGFPFWTFDVANPRGITY